MFRKRFANTYELINSELLEPLFMSCINVMMRYNMLSITEELIPYTQLQYVNALSNATNEGDVMKLTNYANIIAQLNQLNAQAGVAMNMPKTTIHVAEKLSIPLDLIPSEQEMQEIQTQRQEAQQAQAQQAQQEAMQGDLEAQARGAM
ncbi:MAG: portal protein [Fusobacteriaceae bacterium]